MDATRTRRQAPGMAWLAAVLSLVCAGAALAACTEPPLVPPEGPPLPPRPPLPTTSYARCEDGKLYHVAVPEGSDAHPPHQTGAALGACSAACTSAAVACFDGACSNAEEALCESEPATGDRCAMEGAACTGTGTISCPQRTGCRSGALPWSCTCTGGTYACTPLQDLAAVHANLVGKWRGTVMPPNFSEPYQVSLWIYPDGTYWGECTDPHCAAFYYGGDGPHPGRRIRVAGILGDGAIADIGVFQGDVIGELSQISAQGDALSFTYRASWLNCEQPFYFALSRE